jgi:hypothetical protein
LFTHEDKNNVHKIFGFLSLLSFFYRYFYLFPTTGSLGFSDPTAFNWLSIGLSGLLSFSSLIFHVLEKRITRNPLIIYEEYRLHAILFTLRALGVSVIGQYMKFMEPSYRTWVLGGFVLTVHLVVDYITKIYGTPGITAVRNGEDKKFRQLKLFFAFYQFCALASHVTVDPNLCDLGWNTVIAVQSSAFLMTLKRKGLVQWTTYAWFYGLALVLSLAVMYSHKGPGFFLVAAMAFYARVTFNTSKYVIWPCYAVGVYATQNYLGEEGFASVGKLVLERAAGLV